MTYIYEHHRNFTLIVMGVAAFLIAFIGVKLADTANTGANPNTIACQDYSNWVRNATDVDLIDSAISANPASDNLYSDLQTLKLSVNDYGLYDENGSMPASVQVASGNVDNDCAMLGYGG